VVGFLTDAWVKNACFVKFVPLVSEAFLQSRGARLVKANVQDELFLGHGFSIPEPIKNFGLSHSDLVAEESGNIGAEEGFGSWGRKSATNLAKLMVLTLLRPRSDR
jgi:hypothetical protein